MDKRQQKIKEVLQRIETVFFALQTPVQLTKRQEILQTKLELITYNEDFKDSVGKLKKSFGIPINGLASIKDLKQFLKTFNYVSYDRSLRSLLKRNLIHSRWIRSIEAYILFNKTNIYPLLPKNALVKLMEDKEGTSLVIQINPDTVQSDIADIWEYVQLMQGMYSHDFGDGRNQPKLKSKWNGFENKNMDLTAYVDHHKSKVDRPLDKAVFRKYKRAYELRCEGMKYADIAKKLKEEKLDSRCTYHEAERYNSEFVKLIKQNILL